MFYTALTNPVLGSISLPGRFGTITLPFRQGYGPIDSGRSLDALHWGLIPHWSKDKKIGYRTINARSETVDTTPAFRQAFRKRRCLVCADGFYEWRRSAAGRKVPHYFQLKTGEPFAFAGLWENGQDPQSGQWVRSCTILTTSANSIVKAVHDRMPVILPEARHAAWLGGGGRRGP